MNVPSPVASETHNFGFLARHDAVLVRVAALAERYFPDDPVTALMKLRQFGEVLAQLVAARAGVYTSPQEQQVELLRRLANEASYPKQVLDLFHDLRRIGNDAVHSHRGDHATALSGLKIARQLAVWFHKTFHDSAFKPGPFQPPRPPADPTPALQAEIERLRAERDAGLSAAEAARRRAEEAEVARLTAEQRAKAEAEERAFWERYAAETEAAQAALNARLSEIQAAAAAAPTATLAKQNVAAADAATDIQLDEAATRTIIDARLRAQGWEADTQTQCHSAGVRPAKGRMMAVAEWPTASGPADYALFVGTTCVGVVEAKKKRKNVMAALKQAGRYAQGFQQEAGVELPAGGPWAAESGGTKEPPYRVPFLFSTNGRPYLKQVETESGIWFRDARDPTNLSRALVDWPTPEGLQAQLGMDRAKAQTELAAMPFDFGFPLRDYQRRAILAVEAALAEDERRSMLLAMATGTGKTRLAIAMLYRLLTTKRFRRICFVVDRTALGEQAAGEFKTARIVGPRAFADIFGLKELSDTAPDPATKVHICTIQALVNRVVLAEGSDQVPPVDQYDLIVVDECHRGYLLDREMSDAELAFRSEADYVSKYRRVLEHFDAVKIGLTATPALHTTEIFGAPIFQYSYREAVVNGWLIDHEPPLRIETELSRQGIRFRRGDDLPLLNPATGTIDLSQAPDDLGFEVEDFNRKVITREFNRVIAEELAKHIDPYGPGKTLAFAATDGHADILVDELKKAFAARYGGIDDAAVMKITGSIDAPGKAIRKFRNDPNPKVAVTVDLLTTGVDVPSIVNLVFVRRVSSRILYEQMLGRATRRCDDIGKETFRIFDAVGIYEVLKDITAMQPVVVNPNLTLTQLLEDLARVDDPTHRGLIRDQLLVRLRRRIRRLTPEAEERFTSTAGEAPRETLDRVEHAPVEELADWVRARFGLGPILDWTPDGGRPVPLVISNHAGRHVTTTAGYGRGEKPEDYLNAFQAFIASNQNRIAALQVVTQRPRELTRADLKELALTLDREGFSETQLRAAWRDATNEDVAATIAGFVRQAAIGDALEPWAERVRRAAARIEQRQAQALRHLAAASRDTERSLALLDHLERRILARGVRGELVSQNPGDEPAEAFLACLRATHAALPPQRRHAAAVPETALPRVGASNPNGGLVSMSPAAPASSSIEAEVSIPNLDFPDLVSKSGARKLCLEIAIDCLPEALQIGWMRYLHEFTHAYVRKTGFTGRATIWNYCEFVSAFSCEAAPISRSMLHVAFGLPDSFLKDLEAYLRSRLGARNVAIRQYVGFRSDDGWMSVCHVEQGRAWRPVDACEWEPIPPSEPDAGEAAEPARQGGGRDAEEASDEDGAELAGASEPTTRTSVDEAEIACEIRALFSGGVVRPRDQAIRDLALALGYRRVGAKIRDRMNGALLMAVRRRILENTGDGLRLATRAIGDYAKEDLQTQFLASLGGRAWTERDEAIQGFARWLGFARTGSVITETAEGTIRSLLRQERLERDGTRIRRC
jgi:type I restriction enzyme R subunit